MKRVVGLGANVLDTLIRCQRFPMEDKKTRAEEIVRTGGGPVSNALVVMSRLGVETAVIGGFADDLEGKQILSELRAFGVSTDHATILPEKSSFVSYILLSEETQSRTCLYDRGTVPDDPSWVNLSPLDSADLLHLDGNYMQCAIRAAKYAKERGVKVSLDAGGVYEGIEELLPLVDILVPSAEFAMAVTKTQDARSATEALSDLYSPEILVVTDGSNGGYYRDGNAIRHYDSIRVDAIDTNGAGDTFHGALIAAYLEGMCLSDSCRFASAVAAYKCQHIGARNYELNMSIAKNL
ncbi:MAG: bifunctional hydroxymethylpyrimidine kinase/phosphomethylpyrimidine kinase [Clostridia bacterium]|nr:bifunctional hydroxymethylpyrimidine kinase/phosphomethylpyrimidine kinase [Clostridia bacterium]